METIFYFSLLTPLWNTFCENDSDMNSKFVLNPALKNQTSTKYPHLLNHTLKLCHIDASTDLSRGLSTSSLPVSSFQFPIRSLDMDSLLFICFVSGGIYPRGIRNVDKLNKSKNTLYRSLEQKYHGISLEFSFYTLEHHFITN